MKTNNRENANIVVRALLEKPMDPMLKGCMLTLSEREKIKNLNETEQNLILIPVSLFPYFN